MKENNKKSKKKIIIIIAVVAVIIIGLVIIGSIISSMSAGMQAAMEEMAGQNEVIFEVKKEDIEQEITTSGNVIGTEKIAYTSPVTAKVEDIRVEVGQTVNKGDVLITYDASELGDNLSKVKIQAQSEKAAGNASYEMANEAASKTSSAKKKAKALEEDIEELEDKIKDLNEKVAGYEEKINTATVTTEEGVEATTEALTEKEKKAYKKALAELEKKNKSLASKQEDLAEQEAIVAANKDVKVSASEKAQISASNQLSDMNVNDAQESLDAAEAGITAEASGIVESIEVVEGAYASETQTVVTIINADKIGVEFSVAQDDLGSITGGQKARIVVGSNEYEGTVEFVSRVATAEAMMLSSDSTSTGGTIKGRITIDNPDDEIFIGVAAKTYIFVGKAEQALVIPYEALCTDIDGDYVYVVNDSNLIERKDITLGICSGEYYEVVEGLAEGDKVITEVTKDMKPGDEYVAPVTGMVAQ